MDNTTIDEVIEAIKNQWIKDFGKMNSPGVRNGFFMVGFVRHALESHPEPAADKQKNN